MKMKIAEVQKITQRLNLEMPALYEYALFNYPSIVDELANGVGSETNWFYHLTPDTVWGLNINPSSHVHDWDYSIPFEFATYADGLAFFHAANNRFRDNCMKLVEDGCCLLRPFRRRRVEFYFRVLESQGELAFWSNKVLPTDIPFEIAEKVELVPAVIERYRQIQNVLSGKMMAVRA